MRVPWLISLNCLGFFCLLNQPTFGGFAVGLLTDDVYHINRVLADGIIDFRCIRYEGRNTVNVKFNATWKIE